MPFLYWRQRTAVKAVEDALQYIKMCVTGSANTAKPKYFKICWGTSHSTSEQSLQQFIVLLKLIKEYVLKNIPIDNRIWFKNRQTLELLVPKIRSGGSFWLREIHFLKFQNNVTAEFWTNFSYGVALQQLLWNFSGIFIISIKADRY